MHQPTLRVIEILSLVARSGGDLRLTDFSRELNIPKSTLLPILQTMCQNRYLFQDNRGLYSAGTALFSMAAAFSGCFPLLDYVEQELDSLVQQLEETCYFGALEEGNVLYLCKKDSPHPLRLLIGTGRRLPAYATSLGKAMLMDHTEQQLADIYPGGLQSVTPHTVTDMQTLVRQLNRARIDGYTWEKEESTQDVRCFAVPIRKSGRIVAAISVAIPLFRYDESKKAAITAALQERAAKIGKTIEETNAHFGELF